MFLEIILVADHRPIRGSVSQNNLVVTVSTGIPTTAYASL